MSSARFFENVLGLLEPPFGVGVEAPNGCQTAPRNQHQAPAREQGKQDEDAEETEQNLFPDGVGCFSRNFSRFAVNQKSIALVLITISGSRTIGSGDSKLG